MFRKREWTVAVAILAGLPAVSEAQTIAPAETARGVTVNTRPRADFDPLGVRLGAFRLDAAAELGVGYDDNIFGTRRNRVSDGYGSGLLSATIESDWTTHRVGATASLEERRYFRRTDQNWRDWAVGLFGRYDLTPDTSLEGSYNHVASHLETESIDVQEAGLDRPAPYHYDEVQIQGTTRLNRLGLTAIGNYRAYRFDNVDVSGPPQPPETDPGRVSRNDFDSWLGAVGASYALAPGRFVNLIGRIQDIRYQEASQRFRDSFTWEVLGGFTYDFDGVWQARAAVGYRQREYDGPELKSLSGPAFEGEVIWQPTLLTTVTFAARRTIEESIRANSVSFTRTVGQVNVDHEYLRNLILGVELRADRREYEQPSEHVTDGIGVLSARYLINRSMSVTASYQHVRRLDASAHLDEFDRNLVQVRLRVAL